MTPRRDPHAPPPPPPPVDVGAQVLASLARILEQHAEAPRARPSAIYEQFRKMNPKDFSGTTDPMLESRLPLVEFAYNNSYQATIGMEPYEELYGRPCRSPVLWTEIDERSELVPEIVQQTAEVVAKIPPLKGVMRFGKKGKLVPRFVGPFEILDRVGTLAYRVALPPNLAGLSPHMTYEERPDRIMERQERRLRNKTIPMVKVKWLNHSYEEATWETEEDIRTRYPELFVKS
ncbi:uncharacterized protein [Henckelia pumila]|uniref:uncharacterized protein n=1 Tax=Henckelia pumila TaxID=405737 RepID=UPI003C6DC757